MLPGGCDVVVVGWDGPLLEIKKDGELRRFVRRCDHFALCEVDVVVRTCYR